MSQVVATDRKLFLNLAVEDLNTSKAFFSALGFTFNPKFTDENAACMVVTAGASTISMGITGKCSGWIRKQRSKQNELLVRSVGMSLRHSPTWHHSSGPAREWR